MKIEIQHICINCKIYFTGALARTEIGIMCPKCYYEWLKQKKINLYKEKIINKETLLNEFKILIDSLDIIDSLGDDEPIKFEVIIDYIKQNLYENPNNK